MSVENFTLSRTWAHIEVSTPLLLLLLKLFIIKLADSCQDKQEYILSRCCCRVSFKFSETALRIVLFKLTHVLISWMTSSPIRCTSVSLVREFYHALDVFQAWSITEKKSQKCFYVYWTINQWQISHSH